MTESTARAERIKPQSSSAASYLWEVGQKPVSVSLPHGVIDHLEKEVVDNFRSLTSRGSEIGGLLLGSISAGNPAIVRVEDFELVSCDYTRGPLYRLSDADMGRFERAVEGYESSGGLRVVGYFRSHTRKGLSLDAEDLAFLEARFRDPNQVALLVRPYATKASTAGIFIREGGVMRGDSSYQEFPFRSSQLSSYRPAAVVAEPVLAPPPVSAPPVAPATATAAPVPASPKASARAQIVPIASRREMSLPVPPAEVEPPAQEPAAVTPVKSIEPPAPVALAPEATAPVEEKTAEPVEAKKEPAAEQKSKTGMAIGIAAAIVAVVVALFVYPGFLRRGAIPVVGQETPSLSLRVERTGTDILLTWNRDSDAIKTAQHAVLSIFDGERHENYDMDLGQLRNGSIVYSPITADVSFRMDVTRTGKAAPISESVRVLRTRPSPMGDGSQPQAAQTKTGPQAAVKTAQPGDNAADAGAPADAAPAEETKAAVVATKAFDASSLVQRLRPASQTDLLDAPSISTTTTPAVPTTLTGLNLNGTPAAPSAPAPAAPANTAKAPAPQGGQIRQAELISRKEPEYPKLARQMGVKGVVEVTATIGPDGRVKSVKVEKGHPLLTKAATDAVMQWIYKPTLLNGQPVSNDTRISFNFMGEK
jgi:TonB family protein